MMLDGQSWLFEARFQWQLAQYAIIRADAAGRLGAGAAGSGDRRSGRGAAWLGAIGYHASPAAADRAQTAVLLHAAVGLASGLTQAGRCHRLRSSTAAREPCHPSFCSSIAPLVPAAPGPPPPAAGSGPGCLCWTWLADAARNIEQRPPSCMPRGQVPARSSGSSGQTHPPPAISQLRLHQRCTWLARDVTQFSEGIRRSASSGASVHRKQAMRCRHQFRPPPLPVCRLESNSKQREGGREGGQDASPRLPLPVRPAQLQCGGGGEGQAVGSVQVRMAQGCTLCAAKHRCKACCTLLQRALDLPGRAALPSVPALPG